MNDAHDPNDAPEGEGGLFDQIHPSENRTPEPPGSGFEQAGAGVRMQTPVKQVRVQLPQRQPIVTYSLIGLTALVFVAQFASQQLFGADIPAALGMKVNQFIRAGEYWRFITPVFLHGGLLHVGVNMYSLYVLGPQLERHYGHWQFGVLYFTCGITGVVASFLFSDSASLGASTAIFGLLGAFGIFLFQNRKIFSGARGALNQVLRVGALNLLLGLLPGIDNWGHIGGLIGGVLVGFIGGPVYTLVETSQTDALSLANTRDAVSILIAGFGTALTFVIAALFLG